MADSPYDKIRTLVYIRREKNRDKRRANLSQVRVSSEEQALALKMLICIICTGLGRACFVLGRAIEFLIAKLNCT